MNICVFASTNGTDLEAILDEMERGKLPGVSLAFVLVNKADCGAAEKARKAGVPLYFVDPFDGEGYEKPREDYDREVHAICARHRVELIVLVGWMRILSPWFARQWPRKILNVHPSLLPKYPGMDLHVHREVLDNGETETGMTIHYVDEGVDTGDIILQKSISVTPEDTAETLKKKVQDLEKTWYPEVIRQIQRERSDI